MELVEQVKAELSQLSERVFLIRKSIHTLRDPVHPQFLL